ncbi:hypothetical protein E7T06_17665 [Deinococcus sp. Arct2-2]|uniref:hypothetical protein n=1 Tax=Deinococcus sp. Arct2-2 TaxID=2568653 RepID=UPI0010A2C853|nr:hypothetical protein [Deinococcus sp. Arct2-2]THF68163.1 hypothetical protein E7T06_17665 [Deinococcus sp. Arct2-2]
MKRFIPLCLTLLLGAAAAQTSAEQTLRRSFVQTVAPKLDGTSGLNLESLSTLVTAWVRDVRRAGVTTLEKEIEQGVTAIERFVRREAERVAARCTPGAGADLGWAALDTFAFSLKPGLVGDFAPLHTALQRCLSFEVVLRSEVRLQHADMAAVITTGTEAVVPVAIDLRTREGTGQAPLGLTRTDWAFTNGCTAQVTPTGGLLRVEALGLFPAVKNGPLASPFTEYAFRYKLTSPQQHVIMVCPPGAAEVPGAADFTWALPYRLAHQAEYMPAGHYLPPVGSHEAPLGSVLNQWSWRQNVPGMQGASEFTTLKVLHAPR